MISPEVVSRAAAAPKIGQGAWCAIRCFLVGIGSRGERRRRLGSWLLPLLGW